MHIVSTAGPKKDDCEVKWELFCFNGSYKKIVSVKSTAVKQIKQFAYQGVINDLFALYTSHFHQSTCGKRIKWF